MKKTSLFTKLIEQPSRKRIKAFDPISDHVYCQIYHILRRIMKEKEKFLKGRLTSGSSWYQLLCSAFHFKVSPKYDGCAKHRFLFIFLFCHPQANMSSECQVTESIIVKMLICLVFAICWLIALIYESFNSFLA